MSGHTCHGSDHSCKLSGCSCMTPDHCGKHHCGDHPYTNYNPCHCINPNCDIACLGDLVGFDEMQGDCDVQITWESAKSHLLGKPGGPDLVKALMREIMAKPILRGATIEEMNDRRVTLCLVDGAQHTIDLMGA